MMKQAKLAIMPAASLQVVQSLVNSQDIFHTVDQQAVFGGCTWFHMGYRWHSHAAGVCHVPIERHDF